MGLDALQDGVTSTLNVIKSNPVGSSLAVGGLALGAGGAVALAVKSKRKKSSKRKNSRKKTSSRRGKRKKGRRRYTPHTAGKGKDRSRKRIRYTKNGQPYVLGRNGKARFIKRSSAKRSHSKKGGRY